MSQIKSLILLIVMAMISSAYSFKTWAKAEVIEGEYLFKLKKGAKVNKDQFKLNNRSFVKKLKTIDAVGQKYGLVEVKKGVSVQSAIKALESDPNVEFVEPNYRYQLIKPLPGSMDDLNKMLARVKKYGEVPDIDDPMFGKLWGLYNTGKNEPDGRRPGKPGREGADINAIDAWKLSRGSRDIVIAVIDTGIDYNHPDLRDNIWVNYKEKNGKPGVDDDGNGYIDDIHGFNFQSGDGHGDPMDDHGHGTHCAGTIGAVQDNGHGVAGVMPRVKMMGVKFLGRYGGSLAGAIKSIDYATKMDVDIMSNSWGGGGFSKLLKEAIERANEKGILFVAAAGNDGKDNDAKPSYPANYQVDNVISVAAHTIRDNLAYFSNWGKKTVHIAAPGFNILSSVLKEKYAVYSGTSMATPHVSGALGLLIHHEGKRLPVLEVKKRLMETSVPVKPYEGKIISGGRLNAYNLITNTKPKRTGPKPWAWKRHAMSRSVETQHPYRANETLLDAYRVEGAKYVRAVLKVDIEPFFDRLEIRKAGGETDDAIVEVVDGTKDVYTTEYVKGDEIFFFFAADDKMNQWGFEVLYLEYQ